MNQRQIPFVVLLGAVMFTNLAMTLATRAAEPAAAGKQVALSFKTSDNVDVSYLLYLPEDYSADSTKVPLMLFLHGRGESHGPLSIVAKWGPPRLAAAGTSMPYIIVSPQCPGDDRWSSETQQKRLSELLDSISETYPVDSSRVYLTGLSMGGMGSWALAAKSPERFAAVVPICGGGDPATGPKLADLPIWVFHGDADTAVPFTRSVEMVDAVLAAGGKQIRFTTLEHVGHNSWSPAYAMPQLYQWIDSQRRSNK